MLTLEGLGRTDVVGNSLFDLIKIVGDFCSKQKFNNKCCKYTCHEAVYVTCH
ncbi:hypothetical protein [Candidatus Sulfurimonas baltica]|uniref:Uncharacterized protein n=1 Tax=Candidatus Sulfurimonas baltica TaxID=2740404 RepID=A0A7S7RLZ5_9BACT|nr:hypothetical protein [Candidatus Sulfurimonas baltica]QOY50908.1 hypothetical protein HUE88_07065 [Candidatus Sulfurimonas baltica]